MSVVIPEHVPPFANRQKLKRNMVDPRRIVVMGDSETALAAVDGLRTSYAGEIVLISTSPYGQFENMDVLRRKFGPLSKNEVYYVEDGFFEAANVRVMKGELKAFDPKKSMST